MLCPSCQQDCGPAARFCPACGAKLTAPRCACGEPLPPNARFCPACGAARDRMPPDTAIAPGDLLPLLTSLVQRSLAVQDQRTGRYRLLETVRQYARERLLDQGEGTEVYRRHRDHFLALAEQDSSSLTEQEVAVWESRIAADHDNLRAALAWTLAEPDGAEAGMRLACGLWPFWRRSGRFREGREWLERALERSDEVPDEVRAETLNMAGVMAHLMGDAQRGRDLQEQSLAIYRRLGDKARASVLLGNLGSGALAQGELQQARAYLAESLALCRELDNRGGEAYALLCQAELARHLGDYPAATDLAEQALTLYRGMTGQRGVDWYIAAGLVVQAAIARAQGRLLEARERVRDALLLHSHGHSAPDGLVDSLSELAYLEIEESRLERAARLLGRVEALREEIGAPIPRYQHDEYQRYLAWLRVGLDQKELTSAWTAGRTLSTDAALDLAIGP